VNARAEHLEDRGGDAVDGLSRFAEDHLVDLIVAGAYGHSRLRQWALGGVTEGLLDRSPLPVLFSH
jgi:nucleotide-binding universal stress UspA family protein